MIPNTRTMFQPLTERELDVLRMMGRGLSNQDIAASLSMAPSTVKVHTRSIYGKLGVNSREDAITR